MSHIPGFHAPARWRRLAVLAAAIAVLATPSAMPTATAEPKAGGFMSANVEWVAHLPVDAPGVGGRVVRLPGQTRFYVTGVKGLSIYDVTDPALPLQIGFLPLPHWENEDVSVSADGNWVLISHDGDFQALPQERVLTYVIDATNPRVPVLASTIPMGAHIATCADDECNTVYGSDGWTWDLTDKRTPKRHLPGWRDVLLQQGVRISSSVHDLNRDAAGYFVTDSTPRVMFDPRPNPKFPLVLTTGAVPRAMNLAYQHNNIRIRADEWQPRVTPEDDADPSLRPGELLLSNGETNFTGQCDEGSGPFATWSVRDWDKGAPMKPLHVFRPITGTITDGNAAVNALGCSGHWFTYRNGIVAAGWYEHGTRFLEVDPATGEISEVGYYQPIVGSTSAVHWIDDEYAYTVDYGRGIDILRFDRSAPRPDNAELAASWQRATAKAASPLAAAERWRCALAQR